VDSTNLKEHLKQLKVLQILQTKIPYAKPSKCHFGQATIEYHGDIVSNMGVEYNRTKIEAMINWHISQSMKQLRGFFGLTG